MTESLGGGAVLAVGLYLTAILGVGYAARRRRTGESLADFYLAGRQLTGPVLLLTLYATQYSGNTLIGYPGEAYRLGFSWVMSVGFMMAIIVAYLLYAPRLHRLSQRHRFVTPGDWLTHRFRSPALTLIANLLLVAAISNYLLAQLMSMGHITAGLSGGAVPYWAGVVLLTLVVLIYETVGGMRAVAWTDLVQGVMLVTGLTGLLLAAVPGPSHVAEVTAWLAVEAPEKVAVPGWDTCRNWFSTLALIGFSGAVYPQAVQRIYAARDSAALRRSFGIMVFLPMVTTGPVFLVGVLAIERLDGAGPVEGDQVLPLLLTEWGASSPLLYVLSLVVIVAVVSAIMSTADSVLLSLSSMLAKDVLGTTVLRGGRRSAVDAGRQARVLGARRGAGGHRPRPAHHPLGPDRAQDGDPRPGRPPLHPRRELGPAHDPGGARRHAHRHRRLRRSARGRAARAVERPRRRGRAARQRHRLRRGDPPRPAPRPGSRSAPRAGGVKRLKGRQRGRDWRARLMNGTVVATAAFVLLRAHGHHA